MSKAISKKIYSQHVADKNGEIIEVIVHCASNIPTIKGKIPHVFITGQALLCLDLEDLSGKPNTTKPIESNNPEWNDIIFIETTEENVKKEELLILIIDNSNKNQLAEFKIPWRSLKPFYQHNLMLSTTDKRSENEMKVYVSIMRKQAFLAKREMPFYGLEVYLNKIEDNLTEKNSLYAVARIVPSYPIYSENFLVSGDSEIHFDLVKFPMNMHTSKTFALPKEFTRAGYPQILMASLNEFNPTWEQMFMFASNEENAALFTRDAALVIEFYPYQKKDFSKGSLKIKNLSGWCAVRLDQRCKSSMNEADFGLKTDTLLIDGDGSLSSQFSPNISAEIALKLVRNKCPKKMSFDLSSLPVLASHYTEENVHIGVEPVYKQKKGYSKKLSVLDEPEEPVIETKPITKKQSEQLAEANIAKPSGDFTKFLAVSDSRPSNRNHILSNDNNALLNREDFSDVPMDYRYALLNLNQPKDDDLNSWMTYYKNLSRLYRSMVKEMDKEINAYRHQIRSLKGELSTKMTRIDEKKAALLKLAEINEIDRTNLNKAFLELRTRLAVKSSENTSLRDHIAVLERKLERKMGTDKDLEKMMVAQSNQNKELHGMQNRLNQAYGLEDTVKRQDLVIEKLESFIHKLVNKEKEKSAEYYDYLKVRGELDRYNQWD